MIEKLRLQVLQLIEIKQLELKLEAWKYSPAISRNVCGRDLSEIKKVYLIPKIVRRVVSTSQGQSVHYFED